MLIINYYINLNLTHRLGSRRPSTVQPFLIRICSAIWIPLALGLSTLAVKKASAFDSSTIWTLRFPEALVWAGCCEG